MTRPSLVRLCSGLLALAACPGCLTLFSKVEVIRGDEQRIPVRFETTKAARLFYDKCAGCDKKVGGTCFGVPFITFFSNQTTVSDNAVFNDQLRICDTDQDGFVTEHEALIYTKQEPS